MDSRASSNRGFIQRVPLLSGSRNLSSMKRQGAPETRARPENIGPGGLLALLVPHCRLLVFGLLSRTGFLSATTLDVAEPPKVDSDLTFSRHVIPSDMHKHLWQPQRDVYSPPFVHNILMSSIKGSHAIALRVGHVCLVAPDQIV